MQKLWVSKTAKMLLQRKSLAFVAPSGEKYLIFMLLECVNELSFSPAKNYQNSLKRALLRRKKLYLSRLIWPTRALVALEIVLVGHWSHQLGCSKPHRSLDILLTSLEQSLWQKLAYWRSNSIMNRWQKIHCFIWSFIWKFSFNSESFSFVFAVRCYA